jgi:ABC-type phosphate/phosphonate transport system substrate-binding protein
VELVRDGLADVASIDAVTWAGLARHQPEVTHGLRVIAMSDAYPGLPLITASRTGEPLLVALRAALSAAMRDPALAASRRDLFIEGFEPIAPAAYQTCLDMRDAARALGCEVL